MKAIRLQTEFLNTPLGLGTKRPRFSWNCEDGIRQTAYRIVAKKGDEVLWDSGKTESSKMTLIPYEGRALASRERIDWTVTLWDETGAEGAPTSSWFEMGLLEPSDWTAKWISGNYQPAPKRRYPVDCFRKAFRPEGTVVSARLYATARGVYDVTVNGKRIEDFILAPGTTDYRKRIQYQTYDVTELIGEDNTLELRLADGWFRGSIAAYGVTNVFGKETSLMAQLELTMEDGSRQVIGTDAAFDWSNDGPIRFADLKDGENYDARMTPSYLGKAREVAAPKDVLICPSDNVPVREQERLHPLSREEATKKNAKPIAPNVLDFGQNIAGYAELKVRGARGQKIRLVFGEILGDDGHVDQSNFQESRPAGGWNQLSLTRKLITNQISGTNDPSPRQAIELILSGGEDHYKTSFAVFGFRYCEVIGDINIVPEDYTAIAVYSDLEQTGDFACSNELVDQLVRNTRWSMKGNFLDVPTDCPTRERLGWTGDAQIFFNTGAYFMNTAPFFRKWMRDMADGTYPNGLIPAVLPWSGVDMMYKSTGGSVGWADAMYLVPWRYYQRYGDRTILEEAWPMIEKYADYLLSHLGGSDKKAAKADPDLAFTYEKGVHLGEWLEPDEFRGGSYNPREKHPEECTAYLYYSMVTIGKIAEVLGEPKERYEKCAAGAKKAYRHYAEMDTDRQAKLVRPLALGLYDGETRQKAQARLKQAVENYHYHVGTGFLSTPFLLPMLTEAGEVETAYRMLENTEKPGWLGEILDGATTVWEDWEGRASQNHYSPGAVCQWLFDTVCGLRQDDTAGADAAGGSFLIAPIPGGTLTHAEACWLSPYGRVASRWEKKEGKTRFEIEVPANCTARICLPDGSETKVNAGRYTYEL